MVKLIPEQIEAVLEDHATEVRRDMWKVTWKTRFPEVWAGGGLGLAIGGAIGALTAVSAALVAPAIVGALFLPVVGAFAVGGMLMGIAGSTDVGSNVGSQLGDMKVRDRQRLMENPDQVLSEYAAYKKLAVARGEYKDHAIPFTQGSRKIFNWKVGLTLAVAGLAVGGLLAATGGIGILAATSPVQAVLAGVATKAIAAKALTCMTVTACGLFGGIFGIDFPSITANTTEFMSRVFSGKVFERGKAKSAKVDMALTAATPLRITVTPEEMAQLNERLTNKDKNFSQALATQQLQVQPANISGV